MTLRDRPDPARSTRSALVGVILGLLVVSLMFRMFVATGLQHTSLVFIGIPAVLALIVALTPSPRSATGLILKVMTLALLMGGIMLGEAFVCILIASPLFYLVGIVTGLLVDWMRRRERAQHAQDGRINLTAIGFLALAIVPASLEGVLPGFEFARVTTVTATRVVEASARDVADALARAPRFDRRLPAFFLLGFPAPGATAGEGVHVGDRRVIEMRHGRHPGTLTLDVRAAEPGRIEFAPVSDDTYLTHWLSWQRSEVRWMPIDRDRTLVTWTLVYRRRLDPAWYFAPIERYGVRLASGYLIDTLASPAQSHQTGGATRAAWPAADVFCRRLFASSW